LISVKFSNASIMILSGEEYILLKPHDYSAKINARKFVKEIFKAGKTYVANLMIFRSKRSNEANSKAWKLIGEIAKELGLNPIDIYRRHVEEIGKFDQYLMIEEAYEDFNRAWVYDHIGRYSKIIGESREKKGFIWVAAFHGSSSYDSKTMYHFLDNIIQECKGLNLEICPQEEIDAMLKEWDKKHKGGSLERGQLLWKYGNPQ